MKRQFWKKAGLGIVMGGATLGTLSVAHAAYAGGTSGYTNGCYAQWWNTAFNAQCPKATKTGNYQSAGYCSPSGSKTGPWKYVLSGFTYGWFSPGECTYSTTRAVVIYTSG